MTSRIRWVRSDTESTSNSWKKKVVKLDDFLFFPEWNIALPQKQDIYDQ